MLILSVAAVVAFAAMNRIYQQSALYESKYGTLRRNLEEMGQGFDVAALGSAQAYFDYAPFDGRINAAGLKCGNFAENPQALRNAAAVWKENIYRMQPNGQLIITPPIVCFFFGITQKIII